MTHGDLIGRGTIDSGQQQSDEQTQAQHDQARLPSDDKDSTCMNVDRQPHHQPENHDPPRPEHRQRRPQHHEQQEQRPQRELERGDWVAARQAGVLGVVMGYGDSKVWRSSASIRPRRGCWQPTGVAVNRRPEEAGKRPGGEPDPLMKQGGTDSSRCLGRSRTGFDASLLPQAMLYYGDHERPGPQASLVPVQPAVAFPV